jgi:hypothetical protein
MDETDLVLLLAKGFEDSVDTVAGKPEDCVNPPCDQAFYEYIRCVGHGLLLEEIVWSGSYQL